jgi:hypothetical protein
MDTYPSPNPTKTVLGCANTRKGAPRKRAHVNCELRGWEGVRCSYRQGTVVQMRAPAFNRKQCAQYP